MNHVMYVINVFKVCDFLYKHSPLLAFRPTVGRPEPANIGEYWYNVYKCVLLKNGEG